MMVQYWLSIFSGDNGFTTSFLLNWVMLFFFKAGQFQEKHYWHKYGKW